MHSVKVYVKKNSIFKRFLKPKVLIDDIRDITELNLIHS